MNNLNDLLTKITDFLKNEAKTETLIGQQFKLGEYTCVPVISIGMGFGGGGGEGTSKNKVEEGNGAGGGGGIGMAAKGFLVTNGKDIQFIPASPSKGISAAFEKVPEMLEKYFEKHQEQKGKQAASA